MNNAKEEWVLREERVTEFPFRATKNFNMLITNEMFDRIQAISEKKKVRDFMAVIVSVAVPLLKTVDSDLKEWKMYQTLLTEEQLRAKYQKKNGKNPQKCDSTGKKVRKYDHHFVNVPMFRSDYDKLLVLHHKVNTFSIAIIIRVAVQVYLDLYDRYHDKKVAFDKMAEAFSKMSKGEVEISANFILLEEQEIHSKKVRVIAFFLVEVKECGSEKELYKYRFRLQL